MSDKQFYSITGFNLRDVIDDEEQDTSSDYPIGGIIEPYDIWQENK